MRKAIRDAVKARLEAVMSADFDLIEVARRTRVGPNELPAALIYTDGEGIEVGTVGTPRTFHRSLTLQVKILLKAGANQADDKLDALAYGVEDALTSSDRLGLPNVGNLVPAAWAVESEEEDADDRYLSGLLSFTCIYDAEETLTLS